MAAEDLTSAAVSAFAILYKLYLSHEKPMSSPCGNSPVRGAATDFKTNKSNNAPKNSGALQFISVFIYCNNIYYVSAAIFKTD